MKYIVQLAKKWMVTVSLTLIYKIHKTNDFLILPKKQFIGQLWRMKDNSLFRKLIKNEAFIMPLGTMSPGNQLKQDFSLQNYSNY